MRPADPDRPRPTSVRVVVVLTALLALWDTAVGLALIGAAVRGDADLDEVERVGVVLAGGVSLLIAVGAGALAVALWRGRNVARLLFSLLLLFRLGYELYLDATVVDRSVVAVVWLVVVTATGLLLVWNPSARAFFETPQERLLAQAMSGHSTGSRGARVVRIGADYLVRLLVLAITIGLTPGITVEEWWALPLATVVVSLAGELVRPLLVRLSGLFGWLGALTLALFANAAVIGVGLLLTPGIQVTTVAGTVLASWLYAFAMTLVSWVFSLNSQEYLITHAARLSLGKQPAQVDAQPGVLFVQLDGVPAPVLELGVKSGNLPTISRWVRSGTHTWTEWVARVPSTTPVSQAGLLHGCTDDIPAFRWYEKEHGRLVVANHPPDAALIESRVSDGNGLLADGGVSISNLFSGDAPTSLLTMSGLRNRSDGLGPSRSYAAFFTHPAGFFRAVILTIGEMAKEIYQGRRQKRLDIAPRIDRHGAYVALRGFTNVFLRDLNVALIVQAMMSGAKSIYVDFVDYDEIAHHAGVTRPEAMSSLYGLDRVLAGLEKLAGSGATPRPYRIVLVSDHGQSQGATFKQRNGQSLEDLVISLMDTDENAAAATDEVEAWGPVNVFLSQLSGQESVSGRLTKRALGKRDGATGLGPNETDIAAASGTAATDRPPVVVVGSGNLGCVWFPRLPGRLLLRDLEREVPGLVQALASNPYVGFVVVMTQDGPVAIGEHGTHRLTDGAVTGADPLAGFDDDAAGDYLRAAAFEHAPDIYLNSLYDPVLDEVAAFEELVGCHGGVGGWQTRPILVHPADWSTDADLRDERGRLLGAESVHHQMVRWLERLGHRGAVPAGQSSESTRT
ncbi:MAG: phage holin family protein [Jiangellales bacterium]